MWILLGLEAVSWAGSGSGGRGGGGELGVGNEGSSGTKGSEGGLKETNLSCLLAKLIIRGSFRGA